MDAAPVDLRAIALLPSDSLELFTSVFLPSDRSDQDSDVTLATHPEHFHSVAQLGRMPIAQRKNTRGHEQSFSARLTSNKLAKTVSEQANSLRHGVHDSLLHALPKTLARYSFESCHSLERFQKLRREAMFAPVSHGHVIRIDWRERRRIIVHPLLSTALSDKVPQIPNHRFEVAIATISRFSGTANISTGLRLCRVPDACSFEEAQMVVE
ncbi:hypothetical protein SELMODRAFT_420181 [Selaginella moellendorffii]|uniref:Uncharacterized protein n=1 Tax=Selaginella moellendorffii TaxID=88036 RepID=D8SB77_SELML|nr:hypothetical protein SELMODRAFT_420181 [Selaginella moellendorffii]